MGPATSRREADRNIVRRLTQWRSVWVTRAQCAANITSIPRCLTPIIWDSRLLFPRRRLRATPAAVVCRRVARDEVVVLQFLHEIVPAT